MTVEIRDRRRATLVDVARLASVSTSAVSRTFTPGASVSKKTRARVLKAAEELGFRPNALARSLMTGRSALIALVSNAFANPYVMLIISTFTKELQHRNLRPLVFNLSPDFNEAETLALIAQYQIDGVLLASSTLNPDFIEALARSNIPVVLAFGRARTESNVTSVYADNILGGQRAAEEFIARGYRRLGFIGAREGVTTSDDRLEGFRKALKHLRAPPPVVVHGGSYSHAAGRAAVIDLLGNHSEVDGIFCADDLIALGTLDGARFDLGRNVPDLGVIGFNDLTMASWPTYELATLRTHTDHVVRNAIELLEKQIEHGMQPAEKRIIGCEFIERGSVRPRQGD